MLYPFIGGAKLPNVCACAGTELAAITAITSPLETPYMAISLVGPSSTRRYVSMRLFFRRVFALLGVSFSKSWWPGGG